MEAPDIQWRDLISYFFSPEESGILKDKEFYYDPYSRIPEIWDRLKTVLWIILSVLTALGISKLS